MRRLLDRSQLPTPSGRLARAAARPALLAIASVQYQTFDGVGGFADWLQATLGRTTTPAMLTLRTNGTPVPDGRYGAVVPLTGEDVAAPAIVAAALTRLAS